MRNSLAGFGSSEKPLPRFLEPKENRQREDAVYWKHRRRCAAASQVGQLQPIGMNLSPKTL
jgi:hypothetical protein